MFYSLLVPLYVHHHVSSSHGLGNFIARTLVRGAIYRVLFHLPFLIVIAIGLTAFGYMWRKGHAK